MPPDDSSDHSPDDKHETVTELRLALVCYGGVSLAVYMHGVTKELHKLVVAARAFDRAGNRPDADNPFTHPSSSATDVHRDTEAVYFETLKDLAAAGHPLSVVIDIIGGTSAGGINGVVLAKALAVNAGQDALRDLWIKDGDLRKLLRGPTFAGLAVQAGMAAIWAAATAWRSTSLLRSDVMSRNLLNALTTMDTEVERRTSADHSGELNSLIPDGRRVQLFVTTTDQNGFDVVVPSGAGGVGQRDRAYAQVMEFRSKNADPGSTPVGLGPESTPALTFAARATSAFPAAFLPVSRSGFLSEVKKAITLDATALEEVFRFRYPNTPGVRDKKAPEQAFVDGGLIDNAPFDLVIDAIARESAQSRVIRRLVYIEPDPGAALTDPVKRRGGGSQSFAADLLGIKAPLTSHSILKDLLRLRDMNARIDEIGAVAEQQNTEIEHNLRERVEETVAAQMKRQSDGGTMPETFLGQLRALESAQKISDTFYAQAKTTLRATWSTYERMKALAIADRVATAILTCHRLPNESSTAAYIRSALSQYVRGLPEWDDERSGDPDTDNEGSALAKTFLKPHDTPYSERRFLFIIDGINSLYRSGGPPRAQVDALKAKVWAELSATQAAPEAAFTDKRIDVEFLIAAAEQSTPGEGLSADLVRRIKALFTEYAAFLESELHNDNEAIWKIFTETVDAAQDSGSVADSESRPGGWGDGDFRLLASRYLGFPKWDAILFPIMALSKIPQFSPIPVSQFSPREATTLSQKESERPELCGNGLAHFSAFLKPGYRENDYLFGRLDGADLIIRLLGNTAAGVDTTERAWEAMRAIYDAEQGLKNIPDKSRAWLKDCFES